MNKWVIGAIGAAIGAIGLRAYDYYEEYSFNKSIEKSEAEEEEFLAQAKKWEDENKENQENIKGQTL